MDFSAANTALWDMVVQFGFIAAAILLSTFLRRKVPFIAGSLMPTAVIGGFLLLILRSLNVISLNSEVLEMTTYHGIALGFIAMALRTPASESSPAGKMTASKSGAIIVGSYLIQAVFGLAITLTLALTIMPDLFEAAGILLPMGYGRGPGQANNVGTTYEALGFAGGRSFGLAIAASGFICACVVGVIMLNVLVKTGKVKRQTPSSLSGSVTIETFQDENEIPISESVDKLSVQAALIIITYLITYLVTWGITSGITAVSPGLANTVNSLLWGFNFIIGSAIAMLIRFCLGKLRGTRIMTQKYTNNYLLNRISGLAFDVMIIAGIASIVISDLSGLWLPFILMSIAGAVVTWYYLKIVCKRTYGDYYYEGLMSMYGMMTGTISSGILLLREIDPDFRTPAANNLVTGSSFGIIFGAPILALIGLAAQSTAMAFATLGICIVYFALLMLFIYKVHGRKA